MLLSNPTPSCNAAVREEEIENDKFANKYEEGNIPCIIDGLADDWFAYGGWTSESFVERFGDVTTRYDFYNTYIYVLYILMYIVYIYKYITKIRSV